MFNWFSFLTYAVITAITPGMNNIMSMASASRKGLKNTFTFNLGIWLGISCVMLLCTAFCSALSAWIPKIKLPMLIIGAAYMLYLAWITLNSSGEIKETEAKEGFIQGMLLQFINPKLYIYAIVSMEAYVLPFFGGKIWHLCGFALLMAFIGFVFTLVWAVFGSVFKRIFSKYAKAVNIVMALLLVYCAVSLFM